MACYQCGSPDDHDAAGHQQSPDFVADLPDAEVLIGEDDTEPDLLAVESTARARFLN